MELIKELLQLLSESEDIAKKNYEAVCTVLKFDGDYDLGPKSGNQADKLADDKDGDIYYVSLYKPAGDIEAYVVTDKKNHKISYYDNTHHTLVVDDEIVTERARSSFTEDLDDLVTKYKFESGHCSDGAVKAYLELLRSYEN
jgi:hypothetical protein